MAVMRNSGCILKSSWTYFCDMASVELEVDIGCAEYISKMLRLLSGVSGPRAKGKEVR